MNKLSNSFSVITLSIILLSSCQKFEQTEKIAEDMNLTIAQAPLSLDNAINEVNNLLDILNTTRSDGKRTVSTCYTITKECLNTHSAIRNNDIGSTDDPLIYIINFNNNEGYALVAADPTAPSTILALTDTGFLDPDQTQDNPGLIMYLANMEKQLIVIPPIHATYSPWRYQSMGGVMCTNKWGQRKPYNLYSPLIDGAMPPAGCTATALAQLLTIYNYPEKYNGYVFDWCEMEKHMQVHLGNPTVDYHPAHDMIGRLFEQISLPYNLDMQFGLSGSGAYLYNVPRTMTNLGFSNPGTYYGYYDTEEVKQALLDFYPVLVTGYAYATTRSGPSEQDEYLGICVDKSSISYSSGHTWLVDQLIRMSRSVTITSADGKTTEYTEEKELIHCNFGWSGSSNGLYYSGAFDTRNGRVEPLNTTGTAGNYQYYMQTYYGAIK